MPPHVLIIVNEIKYNDDVTIVKFLPYFRYAIIFIGDATFSGGRILFDLPASSDNILWVCEPCSVVQNSDFPSSLWRPLLDDNISHA